MEEAKTRPVPPDGPPPIDLLYRGIPKLTSEPVPASGRDWADVVVVGCGGSGIPAAVSAFENGAERVIVIEKQARAGGNSIMARGIFGCESSVLRQAMIKSDKDEIFTNAMSWHHHFRVNGRVLRAWINQSGDTVEWFRTRGVEFEVGTTQRMTYDIDPHWHCVKTGTMAGPMGRLTAELIERGCVFYTETLVKELTVREGAVTGVVCEKGGTAFSIEANSVILASGGFLSNTELVKKYYPDYPEGGFGGYKAPNMGESIALAEAVGANLERDVMLIKEGCTTADNAPRILTEFAREPYLLWVNRKGRRYVDETVSSLLQIAFNAMMTQPDMESYVIFDENTLQYIAEHGMELSKADNTRGVAIPDIREKLLQAQERSPSEMKIADSLQELAVWIGCKPEALRSELELYNHYCDHGYDADFNKPRKYLRPCRVGPFYGIRHRALAVDTAGPIRVTERMEVIDKDWDPIPGLYAAGSTTAGWQSNDYCGAYLFGGALSYAVNSGRIAGRCAARHSMEQKEAKA